jgi:hypothetical protein
MKNSVAALSSLLALTLVGPVVAQGPQVVDGPDLVATGKVISVGNTSIAIQTDDHGHSISFLVTTTTVMPTLVAVGSRVRVAYHAIGPTGQMADKVTLLQGPPGATSPAVREFTGASGVQPAAPASSAADATPAPRASQSTPQSPATANQPGTPDAELPATASPLPLIGLVGLMALLAGVSLRALERTRF